MLTLAELQTSHWLEIQSGWLRRSTMRTLREDSEFGSSASRGIVGCKFLSRGLLQNSTINRWRNATIKSWRPRNNKSHLVGCREPLQAHSVEYVGAVAIAIPAGLGQIFGPVIKMAILSVVVAEHVGRGDFDAGSSWMSHNH